MLDIMTNYSVLPALLRPTVVEVINRTKLIGILLCLQSTTAVTGFGAMIEVYASIIASPQKFGHSFDDLNFARHFQKFHLEILVEQLLFLKYVCYYRHI